MEEVISDSDYRVIADSLQGNANIRRKANLTRDEVNTCLISHTLQEIERIIRIEDRYPSLAEMMDIAAQFKEELSLSIGAFGVKSYTKIMGRELKLSDKFRKKKDKSLEIE